MKNKGFTLVELLATIIILGIIAVITVPIINNKIEQSKKDLAQVSANSYKQTIDEYIIHQKIIKNIINLNGNYTINENGFLTNSNNETHEIPFNGEKPKNGFVNYKNNKLIRGCIKINTYAVIFQNDKIINLTKESCDNYITGYEVPQLVNSGDGLYESLGEPERYIYRGSNPNNYINLKENGTDVTYRIISYEPDGTIKVIRDASIGNIAWDKRDGSTDELKISGPRKNSNNTYCNYNGATAEYYGCNVWGNLSNTFYNGSTLGDTFNYKYYANNTNTGLTNSTNTGTVTVDSTLNQYLNNTWITDKEMSKYIDNHDFNVGGVYYTPSYTGGDKGLQKEQSEEKLYTWNGKIGLMNITDYVDASLNPECTSVYSNFYHNTNYYYESSQHISGYDNWPCSNRTYNWLPKQITEWSLSPHSSSRCYVWFVGSAGYFNIYSADSALMVRPVFYLKSSVKLGGLGTVDNPYYIVD